MAYYDISNLVRDKASTSERIEDICDCIVYTLNKEKESTEVIEVAMKCMDECISKAGKSQLEHLADALGQKLIDEKQNSDCFMMGLKSLITKMNPEYIKDIADKSIPQLVDGLYMNVSESKSVYGILSVLSNDFRIAGKTIIIRKVPVEAKKIDGLITRLITKIFELLYCKDNQVANEAIEVLKNITPYVSSGSLKLVITPLLDNLLDESKRYRSICCLSSILSNAATRLVKYHSDIFTKLKTLSEKVQCDSSDQKPCEIMERILDCYSYLVSTCRDEIRPYIDDLLNEIDDDLLFDPNYNYDCVIETNNDMEEDDDNSVNSELEYSSESDFDADDYSWKIRRGCIRLLNSLVNSGMIPISKIYNSVSENLFLCFRDHDEITRIEIIRSAQNLVNKMVYKSSNIDIPIPGEQKLPYIGRTQSFSAPLKDDASSICDKICNMLSSQLSDAIKTELFLFYSTFFSCSSSLGFHVSKQIKNVEKIIKIHEDLFDKISDDGKYAILNSITSLVTFFTSDEITDYLDDIIQFLKLLFEKKFNLKLLSTLLSLLSSVTKKCVGNENNSKIFMKYYVDIYNYVLNILKRKDIEQQILDSSFDLIAVIVKNYGFKSTSNEKELLTFILSKVQNDNTRLHSILAINQIIQTNKKINFSLLKNEDLQLQLIKYMNHSSRDVQKASLTCFKSLLEYLKVDIKKTVLKEFMDQILTLYHGGKQYYIVVVEMLDILTIMLEKKVSIEKDTIIDMIYDILPYTQFSDDHLSIISRLLLKLSNDNDVIDIFEIYFKLYIEGTDIQTYNTNLAKVYANVITSISKNSKTNPVMKIYERARNTKTNEVLIPLLYKIIAHFGYQNNILDFIPTYAKDIQDLMETCIFLYNLDNDPSIISSLSYCFAFCTLGNMKEYYLNIY